jgi:hypothetical protein
MNLPQAVKSLSGRHILPWSLPVRSRRHPAFISYYDDYVNLSQLTLTKIPSLFRRLRKSKLIFDMRIKVFYPFVMADFLKP